MYSMIWGGRAYMYICMYVHVHIFISKLSLLLLIPWHFCRQKGSVTSVVTGWGWGRSWDYSDCHITLSAPEPM